MYNCQTMKIIASHDKQRARTTRQSIHAHDILLSVHPIFTVNPELFLEIMCGTIKVNSKSSSSV